MTGEVPAAPIRVAAVRFLRGDTSVVDFTYDFRAAVTEVVTDVRSLDGVEIDLLDLLERWEEAGWSDRPAVVDQLRSIIRSFVELDD